MNFQGMIDLQLMMFLEIGMGWFLRKKNLITEEGKNLSKTGKWIAGQWKK